MSEPLVTRAVQGWADQRLILYARAGQAVVSEKHYHTVARGEDAADGAGPPCIVVKSSDAAAGR